MVRGHRTIDVNFRGRDLSGDKWCRGAHSTHVVRSANHESSVPVFQRAATNRCIQRSSRGSESVSSGTMHRRMFGRQARASVKPQPCARCTVHERAAELCLFQEEALAAGGMRDGEERSNIPRIVECSGWGRSLICACIWCEPLRGTWRTYFGA